MRPTSMESKGTLIRTNLAFGVAVLGISMETGGKPGIPHAEVGVVGVGHLVFKAIGIWDGILAVSNNRHVVHTVAVEIGHTRNELGRLGERCAELLLNQRV